LTAIVGSPSLRLLARRKLHGTLVRQLRRLRTPKGLVLTLLGGGLVVLWFGSLLAPTFGHHHALASVEPEHLRLAIGLGVLLLTILSLSSALVYRGLFVPRQEIERLFSSPLSRSDLVRYRLWVGFARSLFGSLILGLVAMGRMPRPLLAFCGVFVTVQTLPLVNQLAAIVSGTLEKAIADRLRFLRTIGIVLALVVVGPLAFLVANNGSLEDLPGLARFFQEQRAEAPSLLERPVVGLITRPFEPWVHLIAASSALEFARWLAVALGFWILLFELTARLPVDYREISLDTAASVAKRLRRMKRGGGVAGTAEVSRRAARWRIPWFLGRGPAGAIAWRKLAAILRKARGTLGVSVVTIAFVTLLAQVFGHDDGGELVAPIVIIGFGMLYLGTWLRFDFRDELDRMEVIKAWPVRPWRLFGAMLLPQVLLVSGILAAAVVGRALVVHQLQPLVLVIVALAPPVVFAWVALDNAVFLFSPVRFVPGQDGMLQNFGRGALMILLRLLLGALVVGTSALPGWGAYVIAHEVFGLSVTLAVGVVGAVVFVVLVGIDVLLVFVGGHVLHRFDVARDTG